MEHFNSDARSAKDLFAPIAAFFVMRGGPMPIKAHRTMHTLFLPRYGCNMEKPLHDSARLCCRNGFPTESAVKHDDIRRQFLPERNNLTEQEQIEKRSHSRFPVSVNAEAFDPIAKKAATGRVTDMGAGGCFVESSRSFVPGTHVNLNLKCGERVFRCRALVTHAADRGMGLTFTEADPEQGMSVLDWVGELSGSLF